MQPAPWARAPTPTSSSSAAAAAAVRPEHVRNICILGHVDHGKTTLTDALVASNGIISQRMAGQLRYMDMREDEQERGITMEASGISLLFSFRDRTHFINVIDSPGHVDFSSEVTTAVRLCDGAVVLVDVVEGVCAQTHAVLRQTWIEGVRPCLVLNKLDRLVLELDLKPAEAYAHLARVLEQVNAITGILYAQELVTRAERDAPADALVAGPDDDASLYFDPARGNVVFASAIDGWGFALADFARLFAQRLGVREDVLQRTLWGDYYVDPKTRRVLRGAADAGRRPLFAQLVLENIWAVYDAAKDPARIAAVCEKLAIRVHAHDLRQRDTKARARAVLSAWLPLAQVVLRMACDQLPSPRPLDARRVQHLVFGDQPSAGFPAETRAIGAAVAECSTSESAPLVVFVSKMVRVDRAALESATRRHERSTAQHGQHGSPAGTNGSHAVPGDATSEEEEKAAPPPPQQADAFVGFGRVFSGVLRAGQSVYVLGPKHDPRDRGPSGRLHVTVCEVTGLYLMMGRRDLVSTPEVHAGCVCCIDGLHGRVLKCATLASTPDCTSFAALPMQAAPVVRVAVEPENPADMAALRNGLRLLNQADPCARVVIQETGEMVVVAAGEVHLERCLKDLRERFARVAIAVSAPIVPFRETIVAPPARDAVGESLIMAEPVVEACLGASSAGSNAARSAGGTGGSATPASGAEACSVGAAPASRAPDAGAAEAPSTTGGRLARLLARPPMHLGPVTLWTADRQCAVRVRARPLPAGVLALLDRRMEALRLWLGGAGAGHGGADEAAATAARLRDAAGAPAAGDEPGAVIAPAVSAGGAEHYTPMQFRHDMEAALAEAGTYWAVIVGQIWALGPRRYGPNMLVNGMSDYRLRRSLWHTLGVSAAAGSGGADRESGTADADAGAGADADARSRARRVSELEDTIVNGFQIAVLAGPLCEEPMCGVCFVAESIVLDGAAAAPAGSHRAADATCATDEGTARCGSHAPLSRSVISLMKEACRMAFLVQPVRLMLAMYKCEIQATADVLGRVYGVLAKRGGRVISEQMRDGLVLFTVTATLPVIESFGFAEEMRKRSSGLASPQLLFRYVTRRRRRRRVGASSDGRRVWPPVGIGPTATGRSSTKTPSGSRRRRRSWSTLAKSPMRRIVPAPMWIVYGAARDSPSRWLSCTGTSSAR